MELEEATKKLEVRDRNEKQNGFWDTFSFTKLIDTTNLSIDDVQSLVMQEFNNNENIC